MKVYTNLNTNVYTLNKKLNFAFSRLSINSVKALAFADLLMQILAYCSVFPFPFKAFALWGPQECLSTFNTTPIADIKTSKLVEPALMNGSGSPVGGIEPLNISCCIIKFTLKKSKFIALLFYFYLQTFLRSLIEFFLKTLCL